MGEALRRRPLASLLPAALLAAASYAVYSCYDLLSRHYTGHDLPTRRVICTTFISYAFNLNLGSLVGGLGFPLPALLPPGTRHRRDQPHHRLQHADQLARLPAAGRHRLPAAAARHAAGLVARLGRPAGPGRRAARRGRRLPARLRVLAPAHLERPGPRDRAAAGADGAAADRRLVGQLAADRRRRVSAAAAGASPTRPCWRSCWWRRSPASSPTCPPAWGCWRRCS